MALFIAYSWLSAAVSLAVGEVICKHFVKVQCLSLLAVIWEGKGSLTVSAALPCLEELVPCK